MAEAPSPVQFEQKGSIFSSEDSNVNGFLESMRDFGSSVAEFTENLTQVLQVAKFFLQAFRDPLATALIPLIDALLDYLKDLKNIGFGTLTVWPWESGNLPPELDTSKLQQAFLGLIAAANNLDPKKLQYDANGISLIKTKNGQRPITPDQISGLDSANLTSSDLTKSLRSILDFLNPGTWSGTANELDIKDVVTGFNYFLNKRELTPAQVIDLINKSFDDTNDARRPTGTGAYSALVIMFMLPSFSDLKQILQAFVDYFGGFFADETIKGFFEGESDTKITPIDLGPPAIFNNYYFYNDAKIRSTKTVVVDETTGLSREVDGPLLDGTYQYPRDRNLIPMFSPGTTIVQGSQFDTNFQAEVVKHHPIVIKNGKVIRNRVDVKNVRGTYERSSWYSSGRSKKAGIVRALGLTDDLIDADSADKIYDTVDVLDSRGQKIGKKSINSQSLPAFFSDTTLKPTKKESEVRFSATIASGDNELRQVFPITGSKKVKQFRIDAGNGNSVFVNGTGSENNILNDEEFQNEIIDFVKTLKVGAIVNHPYLNTPDFTGEDILDTTTTFGTELRWGELFRILPDMGFNYHIVKVTIDGDELELANLKNQIFPRNDDGIVIAMKGIRIQLGFLTADGSYEENSLFNSFIIVPDGLVTSFQSRVQNQPTESFKTITVDGGKPPDWNFTRIQDFLPFYGDTIDDIINFVEGQKDKLEKGLKFLDDYIKFFERQIKLIQELNQKIQSLVEILTVGLTSSGLYVADFAGEGGISEFKSRLKDAKFAVKDLAPFNEISLETIETITVQSNPITGIEETITTNTLKPVRKTESDEVNIDEPLSASQLDSLKYSGALVFFGTGPNAELLTNYKNNLGIVQKLGNSFLSNLLGDQDSIADKIRPRVYKVFVQNTDDEFIDAQNAVAKTNTIVRIQFTNDAHELDETQRKSISDAQGRQVDFTPSILTSSIGITTTDFSTGQTIDTTGDNVIIYQGEYIESDSILVDDSFSTSTLFFQFAAQPTTSTEIQSDGRQLFNLDFTLKKNLPSPSLNSLRYNLLIKQSVKSKEGATLKSDYKKQDNFSIAPATISDAEFN